MNSHRIIELTEEITAMKKYNYVQSLLILVILATACTPVGNDQAENEEENDIVTEARFTPVQYKNAGIVMGRMEYRNLRSIVRSGGYLEVPPQHKAAVAPLMGGMIKEIFVMEGNEVRKGQILARLEHPDFVKLQEQYIEALAGYNFLEMEYARQKELSSGNVNAQKVFQQTESDYQAARGHVRSLEAQLRMLSLDIQQVAAGNIVPSVSLYSPINGSVSHINGSIGAFAEPGMPIFDIVDNSQILVELAVYEKDMYNVKPGQEVEFVLPGQGDEVIRGSIFNVGKYLDDDTKALAVHASITDRSQELVPGMFVNALIETGSDSVPALPLQAVVAESGRKYIFIRDKEEGAPEEDIVFRRIEVETGLEEMGYVEVLPLEELAPDSEIAVEGTFHIHSVFKPGVDQE